MIIIGWAPIHEACNRGYISIVEELLKAGANVNAKGYNNDTPLIDASVNGHYNLVKLLLTYGADYNLRNNSGKTALEVTKSDKVIIAINSFIEQKMRKNGGNKDKDIVNACLNKSRASPPSTCSSPSKPTSPRLTLRFQTIRNTEKTTAITSAISHNQSPTTSTMASAKSYSVSTTIDKDKDNTSIEPSFTDKQNDNNNKVISSNGSSLEAVSASSDHTYTSIDSSLMAASDEVSRGRKRRKSNDGSVSSTSLSSAGPSPSRSSSASSVASSTQQNSTHSKKHHHHSHHHSHHTVSHLSSKTNTSNNTNTSNSSKDKSVKRLCSSSSDSDGVEASETGDKDMNNKDINNQAFNSTTNVGNTSTEASAPKVPPLRIVLPANSSNVPTTVCATTTSNGGTQSFVSSSVTSTTSSMAAKFPYVVSSSDETFQCESDSIPGSIGSQRITRSSQRVAQQQSQKTSTGSIEHQSDSEESSTHSSLQTDSQHPRKRKIRNNNTNDNKNNSTSLNSAINSVNNNNNSNTTANHNSKDGDNNDNDSSSSSSVNGIVPKDVSPFALPSTNCYQMFLSIRKHIDKKRKEMFLVQPKAPQGFKDYLLNRCSYILEGKSGMSSSNKNGNNGNGSATSKPTLNMPPTSLTPGSGMYEVFCEQEKQRYKLKIQHLIEREKLVLSAEQEILRVHGRAARAMANQKVPFSACTILKDEEIYNILETEIDQNETISNQIKAEKPIATGLSGLSGRTRFNGRLFLSWIQDVDDKWEKIKESMLLRHRKESESLLAMQKLEWEWKLKELRLCDVKTINPTIDDKFVPAVHVSDDFHLLPA
jgi:hypothetical protein